jgi:hypothetical protein
MSRPHLLASLALLGVACGTRLPSPRILGVSPSQLVQGTAPQVLIDLDAVFPFTAAYGEETLSIDTRVIATLGGLPLRGVGVVSDGDVTGFAAVELPLGVHEARVELADGRAAVLESAVTVEPGPFPDSFAIDPNPIADQTRGQPFEIVIRAIGGRAAEFSGVVRISLSRGTIVPDVSGPFTAGERRESVTVLSTGMGVTIVVEDAAGHTGVSSTFNVN